jgi:MFS family permease
MGTTFGAVSMVSSLGMALGPWMGGWVFDTFGAYRWLYIGSLIFGVAAVGIPGCLLTDVIAGLDVYVRTFSLVRWIELDGW